ncbi:MAG: LamG domain-containing protein [Lentisphaeria bacterium]|nr:LamG domain-containing protein [Lentisphaeria bacterium]
MPRIRRVFLWLALSACPPVLLAQGAYPWQQSHARVLPTGDLEWAPEPFVFEPGPSLRYIDYEGGDDGRDGRSRENAWKHHPWDPAAGGEAGSCTGTHTFVFKRGVVYRGALVCRESGTAAEPVRLTSDPTWGSGPDPAREAAVIAGSEVVTGWKQGADHPDIPDSGVVWYADLGFTPRCLWMVEGETVTRIALARTPNWTVSNPDDVKSEWWQWENPEWWKGKGHVTRGAGDKEVHLGIDRQHLTGPAERYLGALVWTEWGIVMGTPFATRVESFDPEQRGLGFQGPWYGQSEKIIRGNRYYLEDKPHDLDAPGEFWFDRRGKGGRLYLRLPGDRDPATARIEAAARINLVDGTDVSHLHVSGLTFRFTNAYWDLDARVFIHRDVDGAAIRVLGSGTNLRFRNCVFEYLHKAVRLHALGDEDRLTDVTIADNRIAHTDHGAIDVGDSSRWGKNDPPFSSLDRVEVLRNHLSHIGLRPIRAEHGHAVSIRFPDTAHVAGNILERCYGAGLFLFGGKGSGQLRDKPLARMLIHHNKVTDPLLNTNDWGGIETWQGGPLYVYNNISGNPGGYWNWAYNPRKPASARFGHAYYLDGSFKNYHFNNIAWGNSSDPLSPLGNTAAFQEIHSYQNTFFHNTVCGFVKGSRRQRPDAGRNKFLANIWQDIGEWVFWHGEPAKSEAEANKAHAGEQGEVFAYETNAYSRNVFHDVRGNMGVFEANGMPHATLEAFRAAMSGKRALAHDIGVTADSPVVRDARGRDFRPLPGGAAEGRGVKVFVPWGLYRTVGEWHFTRNNADPARVIDEHWTMTPLHAKREDYHTLPMNPLRGVGIGAGDYVAGPLEDWTEGALRLNGRDQYLVLPSPAKAAPAEEVGDTLTHTPADWLVVTTPAQLSPGAEAAIDVRLPSPPRDQRLTVHLHWLKAQGWGGFNELARPFSVPVDGPGPYRFTVTPKPQDGLDAFSLLVALTPTGEWKDVTEKVTLRLPAGRPAPPPPTALPSPHDIDGSFLVEIHFRAEPGHRNGVLVAKSDGKRGYTLGLDGGGRITFRLEGDTTTSCGTRTRVNDGAWHHLVAQVDHARGVYSVYLDARLEVALEGEPVRGPLANGADLLVGRGPEGRFFAGDIDFLRISLGTLEEAQTTIEELHAWEFDGPFLRDFAGRMRRPGASAAGAIDAETGRGNP